MVKRQRRDPGGKGLGLRSHLVGVTVRTRVVVCNTLPHVSSIHVVDVLLATAQNATDVSICHVWDRMNNVIITWGGNVFVAA